MTRLSPNSELHRRYVAELTRQEDRLGEIRQEIQTHAKQDAALEQALRDYLEGLNVR